MILSKEIFPKHQNKVILVLRLLNSRTWMTLKTSLVLFPDLKNLCSLIDLGSLCSLNGLNSLYSPISSKENTDPDSLIIYGTKMINNGHFLWNGSSTIQFFTNIWYPFWWRLLRPAYVTFSKIGWWNSNAQTSGIHRYLHFDQKIVFSWPPRSSKYIKSGRKTL